MLTEDDLIALSRERLPGWPVVERVEAIVKGGSDRRFFRLRFAGGAVNPLILMTYTLARPDNPRFVAATQRLRALGVKVPGIVAEDTEHLCVWIEDLGGTDLHALRDEPWSVREPLYRAALAEVAKLHAVDAEALGDEDLAAMEPGFDEGLYRWEQEYFLQHHVGGGRSQGTQLQVPREVADALAELRRRLAGFRRGLVHRDFQSQNVMVREGETWLIDYQGVRPGLPEYDLASLLLDPYVEMSGQEREALLHWYAAHTGRGGASLEERYRWCAAQRLMQALGAYGNLSRNLGKPHFAVHVPVALARLRALCAGDGLLKPLGEWLAAG